MLVCVVSVVCLVVWCGCLVFVCGWCVCVFFCDFSVTVSQSFFKVFLTLKIYPFSQKLSKTLTFLSTHNNKNFHKNYYKIFKKKNCIFLIIIIIIIITIFCFHCN